MIFNNGKTLPTIKDFLIKTVIHDVGLSSGIAVGYVLRKALKVARRNDWIDRESMLVFSLATAIFVIGLGNLIETNELLACFFAGTALNWTDKIRAEDLHSHFSEGVELFFDSSVFLVLGTILPWDTWIDANFLPLPRLILLAVAILLLKRIPIVLLLYKLIPQVKTFKEAVFVGHFGPIGVGALFYSLLATEKLPEEEEKARKVIIPVVTFMILCSILVHGTSAPLIMLASQIPSRFAQQILGDKEGTDVGEGSQIGDGDVPNGDGGAGEATETDRLIPHSSDSYTSEDEGGRGNLVRNRRRSKASQRQRSSWMAALVSPQKAKDLFESHEEITREHLNEILASSAAGAVTGVGGQVEDGDGGDKGNEGDEDRDEGRGERERMKGRSYKAMGDPDFHRHRPKPAPLLLAPYDRPLQHTNATFRTDALKRSLTAPAGEVPDSMVPTTDFSTSPPVSPGGSATRLEVPLPDPSLPRQEQGQQHGYFPATYGTSAETGGGGRRLQKHKSSCKPKPKSPDVRKVSIYDEGSHVVLDDGDNVIVRKVGKGGSTGGSGGPAESKAIAQDSGLAAGAGRRALGLFTSRARSTSSQRGGASGDVRQEVQEQDLEAGRIRPGDT